MAATQLVEVPHLGGIKAGYLISGPVEQDTFQPTCVLINALHTTVAFWRRQFESKELTEAMNLLAIEPLGHGATTCPTEHFTYWDSAIMALQVMDKLGIKKAFAMGTSQGGFIVTRMALLAPERVINSKPKILMCRVADSRFQIQGIIPIGTSMDYESEDSRKKGSWDAYEVCRPYFERWSSVTPTSDFIIDEDWCKRVPVLAHGNDGAPEMLQFWFDTWRTIYQGDEGRKKARMTILALVERDGLLWRLRDVKCPVLWLHGSKDAIWPGVLATEQIELFTSSPSAKVTIIPGGSHFVNVTQAEEVNNALLDFVTLNSISVIHGRRSGRPYP
ncbi:Putative non-heme chloroperoxidase [Cytospora mali]|uniref:Non-heme chloroperoxidase n=1 Tax=Cytospora mali TaxID=578113 RepID=A0A194UXM9_CYTMA|nr:Putative non-heme chloroperoxidase [Valsa mali var. pyri (nom. inval.)]